MNIPLSHPNDERPFKASKWLRHQVLFDDLEEFFALLDPFTIVNASQICENPLVSKEFYTEAYRHYIEALKRGEPVQRQPHFSVFLTRSLDALWALPIPGKGQMVKIRQPVIQVQSHFFNYSALDGKVRPMVFGEGTVSFGLQFSYPQIYEGQEGIIETLKEKEYPNTHLYKSFVSAVRNLTRPTPFLINGQKVNSPIRIDKKAFSWIDLHPGLKEVKIAH